MIKRMSILRLLQEVVDEHADPNNPVNYNECDKSLCAWCESAISHINEITEEEAKRCTN